LAGAADRVVSLTRVEWNIAAAPPAELSRPHAAGENDVLGLDLPADGHDSSDAAGVLLKVQDLYTFHDGRAVSGRGHRKCERHFFGNDLAVMGQPCCPEQVVFANEWPAFLCFGRADDPGLDAHQLGHGAGALELNH